MENDVKSFLADLLQKLKSIDYVKTEDIPDHDMMVGGFPCQDYSVASTLNHSKGIEGKKGVLW